MTTTANKIASTISAAPTALADGRSHQREARGWPIVERGDELRRAVEALAPGSGYRGVALLGEAGAGTSTLARCVVQTLESGALTARFIVATQTGQTVPLGAFYHCVPVDCPPEPAMMLAAAHRAFADEADLVVVIDDAQWLDPLSALLIHRLAVVGSTRLIVTIRSGETVPDAVTTLWKEQHLLRLDVEAFTRAQTADLASSVLGGAVDGSVVDQLHELTSGSPLLLRSLLTTAVDGNLVVERAGSWRLRGPLRAGADLNDLLGSRVRSLAADELEVVETVAAAEVLDWEILRTLCDVDAAARAENGGLIRIVADGSRTMVRLGHPILGDVVRRRSGVVRWRQINGILAQALSAFLTDEARDPGVLTDIRTRIQLAQFMMRSDLAPELDVVTRAAESAVTMSNLALAQRLARFVFEQGGGQRAAIALAEAMSWAGPREEAETVLGRFEPDGADESMAVRWGCLLAANLLWGRGQLDAAREALATVRDRVESAPLLSLAAAMDAVFAFYSNDLQATLDIGLPACESGMAPMAMVWTAAVTAGALALTGRFADASALAEHSVYAAELCESEPQRFSMGLAEMLALTATGDLTGADDVCQRYSAMAAGVPQAVPVAYALSGRADLARGALTSAREALQNALPVMSEALPSGWVMLVAAWCTQAEAAHGNAEAAAAALVQAEQANGPQLAVFWPELELARAWERVCAGDVAAGQNHAEQAARMARTSGMAATEMQALHTCVRFGARSHALRLGELDQLLASPLSAAMSAHGRGLADHDGDRLDEAAERFHDIGALAMAADAAAHAAIEHVRTGARRKELESATGAHWLTSQLGLNTPATAAIENPAPLSDREQEVSLLVAGGRSNREVADRLSVSNRTVERHLSRIFAKLGIADREELAQLLRARTAN